MTLIQEQKHRGFLMDPINNMYQTVFREITETHYFLVSPSKIGIGNLAPRNLIRALQ